MYALANFTTITFILMQKKIELKWLHMSKKTNRLLQFQCFTVHFSIQ